MLMLANSQLLPVLLVYARQPVLVRAGRGCVPWGNCHSRRHGAAAGRQHI